jgi:membrane-associated phospholipid phosphatase
MNPNRLKIAVTGILFAVLAIVVYLHEGSFSFEERVASVAKSLPENDLVYNAVYLLQQAGGMIAVIAVALITAYILATRKNRQWSKVIAVLGFPVAVYLLVFAVKELTDRSRPADVLADPSFPSLHVSLSFFYLLAYRLIYDKKPPLVLWLVPFVVALGRMVTGAHYLLDVIGGLLLGYVIYKFFCSSTSFTNKYQKGTILQSLGTDKLRKFLLKKDKKFKPERAIPPSAKKALRTIYKTLKQHAGVYPVIVFSIIPGLIYWGEARIYLNLPIMGRALLIAAFVGVLIYAVVYFFVRDQFKASLIAIIAITPAYSYRYFYEAHQKLASSVFGENTIIGTHRYFILLVVVVLIVAVYLIKNKIKKSDKNLRYLSILATGFLIFNVFPVAKFWISSHKWNNIAIGSMVQRPPEDTLNGIRPDIYYLVFDRYANEKVLKQTYDFDNSPFLDNLKQKGFYIASDSVANYPFTTPSLASTLNLDYISDEYKTTSDRVLLTGLFDKIENNKTTTFLKDKGYSFTNIGPWWDTTKYNQNADLNLHNPMGPVILNRKIDLARHELLLPQDTIAWPILKKPLKLGNDILYGLSFDPNIDLNPIRNIHRQTNLRQFEMVKQVSKIPGPKFVFAHFLIPHDPYVFDRSCKKLIGVDEYRNYLEQLRCANKKIRETVEYILAQSDSDPIIIIQSDEGPHPIEFKKNRELKWSEASNELLRQRSSILNAYYFPDKNYTDLYQDITPINSFRIIFNKYFGTELPILEDKNYIYDGNHKRFNFYETTDRFNE